MLGLRRQRDGEAKLPPKAPFAFLAALVDLADTAGTYEAPALTEAEWARLTRAMLAGYRLSGETWAREFAPVLATRQKPRNGRVWLAKLLPDLSRLSLGKKPSGPLQLPTKSKQDADAIVAEVRRLGPAAAGDRLQYVVEGHRKYAAATNDSFSLVRMFNRLAEAAKESDPDWAVARAEEALAWDRGNARNWTVVARCLWSRAERLHLQKRHSEAEMAANEAFDVLWESRFRFAYNDVVRNELAKFHRDAGDLETAEAIYREASDDFPEDIFCRNGLAEVLTEQTDRLPEAEAVYRKAMRELTPDAACLCGLAKVLRLIGGDKNIEESKRLFRQSIDDFPKGPYAYNGLGEWLFDKSAATRDEKLREESRALFQQAAGLHDNYAISFLRHFDERWQQRVAQKVSGKSVAPDRDDEQPKSIVVRAAPDVDQMGPAERLGRALLAQWHGKRTSGQTRSQHFAEAEELLALDNSLTGECYAAFIEARGLLLLAREEFDKARQYFEEQMQRAAPDQPLGLRLGLLDAHQRLGEPIGEDDENLLNELGPDVSLLVTVLQVVSLLGTKGDQELSRRLLLEIFPRVRELAAQLPGEEEGHPDATPDRMLASLLQKQFFEPVGIDSIDDLADDSKVSQLDNAFRLHGRELSSAIEKIILSLAA
ncbi:MAG: hypothetical protein O3C40_31645 [Planctomycetota bacterium]|nr:hypothetical protein [Planctomycetota bacterium]